MSLLPPGSLSFPRDWLGEIEIMSLSEGVSFKGETRSTSYLSFGERDVSSQQMPVLVVAVQLLPLTQGFPPCSSSPFNYTRENDKTQWLMLIAIDQLFSSARLILT